MDTQTTTERQLVAIEERVARQVNSVHGYVTAAENESLNRLRALAGKRWDAINGCWQELDD